MKAFLSIKYHADHRNRDQIEKISSVLKEQGWETVCVVRDLEQWGQVQLAAEELMIRTLAAIDSCDLVIVELSEKGVGIGIEAGYAYARNIPVLTIAKIGSDISVTMQGISRQVVWYDEYDEIPEGIGQRRQRN